MSFMVKEFQLVPAFFFIIITGNFVIASIRNGGGWEGEY